MTAHKWLVNPLVVVPKSQADEYRAAIGNELVYEIPDAMDGNIVRKRNACIDLLGGDLFIVDDDFDGLIDIFHGEPVSKELINKLIWNGYENCKAMGAGMWGFNITSDKMKSAAYHPLSLTKPVYWAVGLMHDSHIRYDETITSPQFGSDVDIWLQYLAKYRKIFRYNRYMPKVAVGTGSGGIGKKMSDRRYDRIIQKWGKAIIEPKAVDQIAVHSPMKGL